MDPQTVIAVCELLLVVIGIVSLARRDEWWTVLGKRKSRDTLESNPA
jgi:hypothetical protein